MRLLDFQHIIGKNINYFIELKGYTKSSLSRLTNIKKTDLDQLIKGEFSNPDFYSKQVNRLTKSLNLPDDYFLNKPIERLEKWQLSNTQSASPERSPLAQELLEDLDQLISIAPFYLKNSVKSSLKN